MEKSEQEILQRNLHRFLAHEVFNTVTEEDILTLSPDRTWMHKGQPLAPGRADQLVKEVQAFQKTFLYRILLDEVRYHGQERRKQARTESDLIGASITEYLADVIESKLKKLLELRKTGKA